VLYGTAAFSLLSFALIAVGYRPPPDLVSPGAVTGRLFGLGRAEFAGVTLAATAWTLFNVGLILIVSFGPTFLTARGLPLEEAAWLVSLGTWLGIGTIPLGGYLAQRWGRPNLVMAVSLSAAVAICAVLPWAESPLLPFVAFGVFAWAPAGPIMALVSETLSTDNRAQGMGLFYTWYYAGMGALPPLAGLARDLSGSPDAPVYFASAMMLCALAFVILFRLHRRVAAAPAPA
jgi:predicted MFS family arabinose efflux permease